MLEKDFQSQWTKSIKERCNVLGISFFYDKIADMASKDWYSPKKPFDCWGIFNWLPVAFELKKQGKSELTSFAFDRVQPHQLYYLDKFQKAWWKSWIIIYLWETKDKLSLVYTVDTWLYLQTFSKRKSITIEDLISNALLTLRREHWIWMLDWLII